MSKNKNALLLGATGLVGSHVLKILLQDFDYKYIYCVSRVQIPLESEKVRLILAPDFDLAGDVISEVKAEDFSAGSDQGLYRSLVITCRPNRSHNPCLSH